MRRKWVADLALYLPALLIAFVIWLIAKQGDTDTRLVAAPVRLVNVPDNVQANPVPTNMVEVNLIFPKSFLKNILEPGKIQVRLPVEGIEAKAGVDSFRSSTYPLLPSMVQTGDLPPSVRVLGVTPENLTVEARLNAVEAEVRPRVTGEPGPGYELREVQASPAKVELTGSAEALAQLQTPAGLHVVVTEPVSIAGRNGSVSVGADLALPAGVRPVNPQTSARVEVTADIKEKRVTRTFKNVPITYVPLRTNLKVTIQPPKTTVTVKGPRSKVDALTSDTFRFAPNAVPTEAVGATNILSFRVELGEGKENDDLSIEADVRAVTLLFEEKTRPTPTSVVPAESLLLPETGPLVPYAGEEMPTSGPAEVQSAPPPPEPVSPPRAADNVTSPGVAPRARTAPR